MTEVVAARRDMPSSDYGNVVGGGLKLKGAKNAGIKKKKKSQTSKPSDTAVAVVDKEESDDVQKVLADEDVEGALAKEREDDTKQYGKTEAQRRFEERRRKRVSIVVIYRRNPHAAAY